jgi:hypothetical protein
VPQRLFDRFPRLLNRENISKIREIFNLNRDFTASHVESYRMRHRTKRPNVSESRISAPSYRASR